MLEVWEIFLEYYLLFAFRKDDTFCLIKYCNRAIEINAASEWINSFLGHTNENFRTYTNTNAKIQSSMKFVL